MSWIAKNKEDNFKHVRDLSAKIVHNRDEGISHCGLAVVSELSAYSAEQGDRQQCPNDGCAQEWAPLRVRSGGGHPKLPRHKCPDCDATHIVGRDV